VEDVDVDAVAQAGMAEMSEKYKEMGNKLYLEQMENVVNPLGDITSGEATP